MRSTLFTKIMGIYLVVVLLIMAVVGWVQLYMVRSYLMDTKERELVVRGQDLAEIIKPMIVHGQNPRELVISLNRADRRLGTEFWVVNNAGKVIVASADHIYCEGNTLEAADLQQLKAGQITVRRGQSQYFKEAVIRVVTPVLHNKQFLGAVIIYSPVTGVNEAFNNMKAIHIGAATIGLIVAIILGWTISRYISRPIQEVSQVAQEIAEGNFQSRVVVKSRDELGILGNSFNHMAQRLENYENMRREFVANVSHELRSPITSIQGFIEAIVDGKNPDETPKYLAIIQKETHRIARLVNELLVISRYDAEVEPFNMETFPVQNVIKRAINSLQPQASEKNFEIRTAIAQELPAGFGDEDKIEQVIHNLLENAIRYSPPSSGVLITANYQNSYIIVEVTDSGAGIPEAELPRIWERFYRLDKARSRDQGGTGLGLAIVKEIIRKHGGKIAVESEAGQGTTFSFTLPVSQDQQEDIEDGLR